MSEQSYSVETDLREAEAMVSELESYIRGEELYGVIGGMFGGGTMPRLTVGALLMRLRRLRALQDRLSPEQRGRLEQVEQKHAATKKEWSLHYSEKIVREAHSRLDAMTTFFEECTKAPRQCADNYPPELLRRTIVQELSDALGGMYGVETRDLTPKMQRTDSRFRRYAQPASFQWDAALQDVYPQGTYWWLYARPQLQET